MHHFKIYDFIAEQIRTNNDFVTLGCGAAFTVLKKVRRANKRIPVARNPRTGECEPEWIPVIPDVRETAITFIEEQGVTSERASKGITKFTGSFDLVIWLNHERLGTNLDVTAFVRQILTAVPLHPANFSNISRITIKHEGFNPNRPNPYERYSLDEQEKQYAFPPYVVLSARYTMSFTIPTALCQAVQVASPDSCIDWQPQGS